MTIYEKWDVITPQRLPAAGFKPTFFPPWLPQESGGECTGSPRLFFFLDTADMNVSDVVSAMVNTSVVEEFIRMSAEDQSSAMRRVDG